MVNGITHNCPKLYGKVHFQFFSDLKGLSLLQELKSSLLSTQHMDIVTERNNFDPQRKKIRESPSYCFTLPVPAKKIDPELSKIIREHPDT